MTNRGSPPSDALAAADMERAFATRDLDLLKNAVAAASPHRTARWRKAWSHNPPLSVAIDFEWPEAIELLAAAGCSLEATGFENTELRALTPLMLSAHRGSTAVGSLLARLGAATESKNHDGHTAMAIAAMAGHGAFVRMLAEAGADLEAANIHGMTVLMLAAHFQRHDALKTLLELGADPKAIGPRGETALHMVVDMPTPGVAPPSLLMLAAAGASIDAEDGRGQTPLMRSIAGDWPESAQALLDAGADPLRPGAGGRSAFDMAKDMPGNRAAGLAIAWGEREILLRSASASPAPRSGRSASL